MIIGNFNILRTGFTPFKTYSELVIYSDTELSFPWSRKRFQSVSGWYSKFIKEQYGIKPVELSCGYFPDLLRAGSYGSFCCLTIVNILCGLILESLYHKITISRIACYVNLHKFYVVSYPIGPAWSGIGP